MNPTPTTSPGRPHPCSGPRALSRFISLSVATAAAALLMSSCGEKEPAAWVPPAPPPAAGGPPPSSAPAKPVARASAPATADDFKDAARKHFDATAFLKKRALQQKQWAAFQARKQAREKSGRKQPGQEMMRDTNDDFVAEKELKEKTTTWRAQWEAKEWAGYPLPETLDPALTNPPVIRYDVTDEHRAVPPYLPSSAHQAWEDFWKRSDARRDQLFEVHLAQIKAVEPVMFATLKAGGDPATDPAMQQADAKVKQAKADVDAFIERTISTANAWRTKNWEGYTAPADPNAPPPEIAGVQ